MFALALGSFPVYNTGLINGSRLAGRVFGQPVGREVSKQPGQSLKQTMAISIQATQSGDGLRPVDTSRDLPQIIELLKAVFGDALESDEPHAFGDSGARAVNELYFRFHPTAQRLSNGFVWQADGRIVGNATVLTTKAWDRYLVANVAVHPSYRRRGIARALMQAITATIRTRGGRVILLQVVKDNHSAIDLYRSLGYISIGNMATWYATAARARQIPDLIGEGVHADIRPLPDNRWREAYDLDTSHVQADLNWPEPLQPDAYHRTLWRRASDFLNGRSYEGWAAIDSGNQLMGLTTITGEWGRSHVLTLRVRPDWAGSLERPLLSKALRRLYYLPRRNIRIDHPEADELTGQLLREANFSVQRVLTHMRLDISR